jgi:hypothetical protein
MHFYKSVLLLKTKMDFKSLLDLKPMQPSCIKAFRVYQLKTTQC